MIQNYLVSAFRSFRRHRGNAVLNIASLAMGLASSTLILMYVQYELSYDTFHEKSDRIFRVYKQDPGNIFIGSDYFAVVPAPLGPAMVTDFPEVEAAARFTWVGSSGLVRVEDKAFMETGLTWAEPATFSIFDVPFVSGDPATALSEPNTAVISEDVAARYFGTENPIGKTIRIRDMYDMRITAVMKNIPKNSHVTASIFLSFTTYETERREMMNWGNSSYETYVLLKTDAASEAVTAKLPQFTQTHMGEHFKNWGRERPTRFLLQPLRDIHLHSSHINFGSGGLGDINVIYVLSALALVILATGSINYMNLATARASLRAREVGIRKVAGAGRAELMRQFIGESMTTATIAGCVALIIVELLLPSFSRLVLRELPDSIFSNADFLPGFIGLTLLVGFVSGSYPSFILSAFTPVGVLKGVTGGRERSRFRDVLVVAQFSAAIGLAICAAVILDQLTFIRSSDPGYNREQVVFVRVRYADIIKKLPAFLDKARTVGGVTGLTTSTNLPVEVTSSGSVEMLSDEGEKIEAQCYQMYADERFLDVYRIPLISGRMFAPTSLTDDNDPTEYVVNEAFARTFGLTQPVGKTITRGKTRAMIVGVMKDFHLHSFRLAMAPLFIAQQTDRWISYVSIRLTPGRTSDAIEQLRNAWTEVIPNYPFDFAFVDDSFDKLYARDERLGTIVASFTILALFVAAMGLFGLATLVSQMRRREIGVRKVLGASSTSVAVLLSREFMILVGLANVVASPAAYFMMDSWLSEFAYRIPLSPWVFVVAGTAAALIALMTVNLQALRAARANPVESLRYE